MIKAVVYDIDNTLTDDVSWLKVTGLLGASVAAHEDIFSRFSRHELPYDDAKAQLIRLWQDTGKANKPHWEKMFADWPLKHDAGTLVDYTHQQGYKTALITGSLDLFAEAVARKLGIAHWYANTELVWSEAGELIDFHYVRDQAGQKLLHLKDFTDSVGIAVQDCAVIGDGDNDIELFRATGHGIAVSSSNAQLLGLAWHSADTLTDVIPILQRASGKSHGTVR